MIPNIFIQNWSNHVKWQPPAQIEQDLIISRALVDLYNDPHIKDALVFRGGTALNKLFINPPSRYSEDIDFVQKNADPIGQTINAIREVLKPWLGDPKWKITQRSAKLIYKYESINKAASKLKIEINTTEHFQVLPLKKVPFSMDSDWFKGTADIITYEMDELMATKLRALYQRRKGRDLFDVWYVADRNCTRHQTIHAHCAVHGRISGEASKRKQINPISCNTSRKITENNLIGDTMTTIIETERLILRTWNKEDAEAYFRINQDPKVIEFLRGPLTMEQVNDFIPVVNSHGDKHGYTLWAACLKETGELIGFIGLNYTDWESHFTPAVEVGWRLGSQFWGKGYATEGAKAALDYGFKKCGLKEIVSFTVPENVRSIRVMEKIGLKRNVNGDFAHPKSPADHPLSQHILYRLSEDEYLHQAQETR